jgi:transcriptional regulator with XRE-family HTH domain
MNTSLSRMEAAHQEHASPGEDAGQMLAAYRLAAGMAQPEVAQALGVSRSYYSRLERTGCVPYHFREKLASLFALPEQDYPAFFAAFSGFDGHVNPQEYSWDLLPKLQDHFALTNEECATRLGVKSRTYAGYVAQGNFPPRLHDAVADLFALPPEEKEQLRAALQLPLMSAIATEPLEFDPQTTHSAALLAALRAHHGLSIRDITAAVPLSKSQYYRYEKGAPVPLSLHAGLAELFQIPAAQRADFDAVMSAGHTPKTQVSEGELQSREHVREWLQQAHAADTHAAGYLACFTKSMPVAALSRMQENYPQTFEVFQQVMTQGRLPDEFEIRALTQMLNFVRPELFADAVRRDRQERCTGTAQRG